MASPTASIIVRCYNEREHIGKLLYGIFEQEFSDFEVLLVDSGSTDGTLEEARKYPIEDIVYIDPSEFSFGRALNYGCERARGEFCIFASAHVYPRRKDWLGKLLEKFDDDLEIALVYGKQRGNHVTKFSEKRVFRRWFPDEDIDRQNSPFCNNANAAIRRELWEKYPYDESLTGLEDLDWAKQVRNDGYEISYASDAEIVHVHDETPRQVYDRYRREAIAYNEILEEEQFTIGSFLETFVGNTLLDYWAALKQKRLLNNVVSIPTFRFLQFLGTYHGFNTESDVSDRLRRRFYYPDTDGYPTVAGRASDDTLLIDYAERSSDDASNTSSNTEL